ncbi:amino acid adenylation domain-containing protein [Streptosporangium sp. NPDC049644]|uniref:amino acid adenylation domain-containing protein n=1 Tax=Streptosporangium sp. NPDC049644 TaxID=3155507 RepID=UPI003419A740
MTDEPRDEEPVRIGRVNVRSADQPIAEQAALIVNGLRGGAYHIVDVNLLDDHRFESVGLPGPEGGPSRCLHEVVAWRARTCPDAIAVVTGDRRLTYRELEVWAEALATRLRELGVAPEVRVAVCLPRSAELVVAALATLKAGGVYVPLDPAQPARRLGFILADTGARVIVGTPGTAAEAGHPAIPVVTVRESASRKRLAPQSPPSADGLAYIMYTSGSTGVPKGVMVSHRSAVNYLWNMGARWGLGPGDTALQLAHPSFSASIRDLFGPLLHGAAVELLTDESLRSPEHVVGRLTAGVTCVLSCFPSLLRTLLEAWPESGATTLRLVMIISETLPPGLLALARRRWGPDVRVVHQYGLTECAMTSLWWSPGDDGPLEGRVPIGGPIPHTSARVLTDDLRPVRPGAVGELHIGGTGLARGYLNRPGLTAERFVADPFSPSGGRLFKTGDLARRRPDGSIELVGRRDHQVKVRGFRVELGEIEAALHRHEQVAEAVVVLSSPDSGPGLVAYLVPTGHAALTPAGLRAFLGERLPGHMVPARYVMLDALPRTARGKIDRAALPAPGHHRPELDEAYTAPRDPAERALAEIWCEVLGVDRVGVHDDVFDLGCDSLLLIRALARIRARLGADVPVRSAFEHPTVAALAATLPGAGSGISPPGPEPAGHDGPSPLSDAQRRLWYVDRLAHGSPLYTVAAAWRLEGAVGVTALQRAVDRLVARHDALRTVFVDDATGPGAVVREDLRVVVRVRAVDPGADPAALVDDATRLPFDLRTGPLLRVALFAIAPETHVLLLTAHHIVVDARGLEVLLDELALAYGRPGTGEIGELPPVTTRPADLVAWQRALARRPETEAALEFWRARLAGAPALVGLPADRPRPAVPDAGGAVLRWRMPSGPAEGLERLARREGATFFMAALAGWAALLARWSGQDDLVITVPVAGRDRVEDERLVGCLMNLLPIRIDLGGGPSYRTLLGRVRAAVLSALAHRHVPFDVLVGQVAPRHEGVHPLAQVLFDVEREPSPLGLAGLRATRLEVDTGTAKADLSVTLRRDGRGLTGCLEYDVALFDEATLRPLTEQLETALAAVVADPDLPLATIPLIEAGEGARLAPEGEGAVMPYPEECLHELVARQARSRPEAPAVVGDRRLTYLELEEWACALAGRLRELGVGPGVRVGVCVPRSAELVVAVLAVLKAGGAYVPLDPAHPAGRLALLLARTGAKVCVAAHGLDLPVPLVHPGEHRAPARHRPPEVAETGPDDLAAVYFTSGSSGEPKCVQITHRNWVNRIECMRRDHRLDPGERVLHKTALSFDDAVVEIFWPLTSGGCVAVLDAGDERSPSAIVEAARAHRARYLFLVPSMLAPVVAHVRRDPGSLGEVRAVFTSGEPLTPGLVGRYYEAVGEGGPRLYNHWGVTEAGIDSTSYACTPEDGRRRQVPIGKAIGNVRVHVLDAALRPVPVGVVGELCVGGAGVGLGYLDRPRLNAERFPADPYAATPGARLYRTGDLVRRLPGGDLEFLGRRDQQVKVRGNRVELGEVEAALEAHRGVRRAVVSVRPERGGGQNGSSGTTPHELVAHIVCAEPGLRLTDLRAHLRARVPGYMVPDAFVVLDALPTLPSGKVDRAALPDRGGSRPELETAFVAPRTPAEERLAGLWREALGIERVGVHDDFFDVGGHSLRAAVLAARIEAEFGVPLPLRMFLRSPTIEALGRWLTR